MLNLENASLFSIWLLSLSCIGQRRGFLLPDNRILDELRGVVQRKVDLVGEHFEPATRAVELLVGGHPEGVEGAGHHRHLGASLQSVDGVRGDGGDAGLV